MALYINGDKVVNSLVIDGQVEGISLVNNCRIGVTASNKAQSPVDTNNYIDVSGTTVTLKRNDNTYHLWIYSPQLLQVGKAYAFVFDSITNFDENYYIEYTSDITTNPIVATRISYADSNNILNGFVIEPTVSAYYGVAIWSNNKNDIVVNNPRFIEIGKNMDGGGSVPSVAIHSGKINLNNGTIEADNNYFYTDLFDAPNGNFIFDLGESSNSNYLGVEMCSSNGSHVNYWSASSRFREANHAQYYSQAPKFRLSFRAIYLNDIVLMYKVGNKVFSNYSLNKFGS